MKITTTSKPASVILVLLSVLAAFGAMNYYFADQDFSHPILTTLTHSPDSITQRKQSSGDSIYNSLINVADKFLKDKKFEQCLIELEKAQKIRPYDPMLKDRILKTKSLLNDQKTQTTEYQKDISLGDQYFEAKDYLNAKASYQLAIGQMPGDSVAKIKLRKTMDLLRSSKARNILYDVAVASADRLFQAQDFEKARIEYENASKIIPGEQYPKTKINEIIKIQVDRQVKDEEYTRSITSADKFYAAKAYQPALKDYKKANAIKPDEKYPQDRIAELTALITAQMAKDEAYKKAIANADQLFREIQFANAKKGYQQALTIKPEEIYPKDKILEIDGLLSKAKQQQESYDQYIAFADSLYIDKNYQKAKENYLLASSVKPKENYPKEMVSKVEQMITGHDAALARSLNEQYTNAIASGDKLFSEKSYLLSRAEYLKASNLKPLEQYPKEKITEVNERLLEDQYLGLIRKGDSLLTAKVYEAALLSYQGALKVKPGEVYPQGKVAEIN
ncbi:MAG: hypothetical protein M0P58_06365, partial [Bacteroidales bacterium]|nr:hypothetical protein [Bacteroidales bacterium]